MIIKALVVCVALATSVDLSASLVKRGIEFARVGEMPLLLDLYRPEKVESSDLIVWVHGGAWRSGNRRSVQIKGLVEAGWAIASVDYRLSPVAKFPAQIHDIKAAIRFLRTHGDDLGIATQSIAIAGVSAGGHLAALVGVSNGDSYLEGEVGDDADASSDVDAIVSFFGASNLTTILSQSTRHGLSVRVPALDLLLGGQPDVVVDLARKASPVFYVDTADPPLLLIHGDQDPQMPINQSHELVGRYQAVGVPVEFIVVHGGAHGGEGFFDAGQLDLVKEFLLSNATASE